MLASELVLPSAVISLGLLGLGFGLLLALASRVFHVEIDPRIPEVEEALPGAQCGACGYPGCSAYAEAAVRGEAPPNLCMPGGPGVASAVAGILGLEAGEFTPKVAVVRCRGGRREAVQRAEYHGIPDCNAAELVAGGPKGCVYGCLGFGTCVAACPFDAMAMSDNGLPVVFEDKCTGCGNCVGACPRGIMELIPRSQPVYLACVSKDKTKDVKAVCAVGCTGCKSCTRPKVTPSGAVKWGENLPLVPPDWEDFEGALEKCPAKAFMVRDVGLPRLSAEAPAEAAS